MDDMKAKRKTLNLRTVKLDLEGDEDLSAEQIRELNKLIDIELARIGIEVKYAD